MSSSIEQHHNLDGGCQRAIGDSKTNQEGTNLITLEVWQGVKMVRIDNLVVILRLPILIYISFQVFIFHGWNTNRAGSGSTYYAIPI